MAREMLYCATLLNTAEIWAPTTEIAAIQKGAQELKTLITAVEQE
jgi:hypothetical protein